MNNPPIKSSGYYRKLKSRNHLRGYEDVEPDATSRYLEGKTKTVSSGEDSARVFYLFKNPDAPNFRQIDISYAIANGMRSAKRKHAKNRINVSSHISIEEAQEREIERTSSRNKCGILTGLIDSSQEVYARLPRDL